MSVNKVDYELLSQAQSVYANQASALDEIINTLTNMNNELQGGWTNLTAEAFIQRFESDHKVALQNARDSIQEISTYIAQYSANCQDEDQQGASAVSG
ncbi:MAG: WXG100 family type VII secretion target [Hespellia sp.]|nr:WXG100 family type VII secretion target [Hespellia sp.]